MEQLDSPFTHRKTCRVCGSSALNKVIDLGEQYLQGAFIKPGKKMPSLIKFPTALVKCDQTINKKGCGLLQMETSVSPEILYSSYWYRSGTNQTMQDHLKNIADSATSFIINSKRNMRVLDIGCNDGTLLRAYPISFVKFGVDPSDVAQEVEGDITVIQDIFPSPALNKLIPEQHFDIITSIAMFYDLEDPISFVKKVKTILDIEGIFVIEVSYMPAMLAMNSYDTICHEHLEYYSFSVLENIMQKCDMKVVKVEFNGINGGSIRCYVSHLSNTRFKTNRHDQELEKIRQQERELKLDTNIPYEDFQDRINRHKDELSSLLKHLKQENKKIHIYGASTKGNTLLQWCSIDKTIIDYAADRNPDKDGSRTIGTDILIINEEKSRAINPDYYLVLPWHFREEFLEREKTLLDQGTSFIFPLPTIEIVKR